MNFYNQPKRKFTRIIHYTYSIVQIQYNSGKTDGSIHEQNYYNFFYINTWSLNYDYYWPWFVLKYKKPQKHVTFHIFSILFPKIFILVGE